MAATVGNFIKPAKIGVVILFYDHDLLKKGK